MARHLVRMGVGDLLELVGGARVLGLRVVVEIDHATLVDRDVLEDRPERARHAEDVRLGLGRQPDHLRVAAAFEVEDAVRPPAVLVVPDQRARGVGRERRLARAREAEEDRDVAVRPDVGGAVHREDLLQREAIVHHGEDRLLDLAGIERAADDDLAAGRMEDDERARSRPVRLGIRLDVRRVEHERLRLVGVQLVAGRTDEHRLREQGVVRARRDHADADPMLRVGAGERVDHVETLLGREEVGHLATEVVEARLLERPVDLSPPDPLLGAGLAHDELVLRRAAGESARVDDQRATLRELPVPAPQRVGVQLGRGGVPEDLAGRLDPVPLQPRLRRRRGHRGRSPRVLVRAVARRRTVRVPRSPKRSRKSTVMAGENGGRATAHDGIERTAPTSASRATSAE